MSVIELFVLIHVMHTWWFVVRVGRVVLFYHNVILLGRFRVHVGQPETLSLGSIVLWRKGVLSVAVDSLSNNSPLDHLAVSDEKVISLGRRSEQIRPTVIGNRAINAR